MNSERKRLYERIRGYSERRHATNTAYCLEYLNMILKALDEEKADQVFNHAAGVAEMFINVELPLTMEERDIAISACLLHILPTHTDFAVLKDELNAMIDPRITEVIELTTDLKRNIELTHEEFYSKVQNNKLALTVLLAQRSDRVSKLHTLPIYAAKRYIYETRKYYFPICIYGKDHYPEMYGAFSIFLEKMRCIIDTLDMLMSRFEKEENELLQEKLRLQEENSRLRMMMNSSN